MLVEAATAMAVVGVSPRSTLAWAGLALLAVIWLSTAFLQVPRHRRLAEGFDCTAHRHLVTSNWVRTAGWTARGAIALVLLAKAA
jgi:hypothetical protein